MKLNKWFQGTRGGSADSDAKPLNLTLAFTPLPAVLCCPPQNCPAPCDLIAVLQWMTLQSLSPILYPPHQSRLPYPFLLLGHLLTYQYADQGLPSFWSFSLMLQQEIIPSYLSLGLLCTESIGSLAVVIAFMCYMPISSTWKDRNSVCFIFSSQCPAQGLHLLSAKYVLNECLMPVLKLSGWMLLCPIFLSLSPPLLSLAFCLKCPFPSPPYEQK